MPEKSVIPRLIRTSVPSANGVLFPMFKVIVGGVVSVTSTVLINCIAGFAEESETS